MTLEKTANCPWCGKTMQSDDNEGERFECPTCVGGVFFMEDGVLVDSMSRHRGNSGNCEVCQGSLRNGESFLPWENGNNPNAYVRCPSCGHENIRYGFGEDD